MAVDVIIRIATISDAHELAPCLRPADATELRASTGREPLDVILQGIEDSAECYVLLFNGELVCIWGVVPGPRSFLCGRIGYGWLLTSSLVERFAKTFWKVSVAIMHDLLERWDELVNAIDVRHTQALRWARRLGFRLDEPAPFGVSDMPFCRFSVRKEDLCASR